MRIPRDIDGKQLTILLAKYSYEVTRQTGSHIRLTSTICGEEHHITIPNHNPLRIGTLSAIQFLLLNATDFDVDLEPQPFTMDEYIEPEGLVQEILRTGIEIPCSFAS